MERSVEIMAPTHKSSFDCQVVPEKVFLEVLRDVADALEGRFPHAFIGGLASATHGRPRWTYDIDVFVRGQDAREVLRVLAERDFDTHELDPVWIYKAIRDGVLVDVIFQGLASLDLDDEMLARSTVHDFHGVPIRVVGPEDVVVFKAAAHKENRARDWHDALGVISRSDLDWEYLVQRARHSIRRVASLLLYAQSNDLVVPDWVIKALVAEAFE
jgi:hypothetical protein